MHFFYDAQSCPAMVEFNGAVYSYVHNLQGDVVGIVDSAGSLVVEYKYDAWGMPTLVRTLTTEYEALAELNPFRYRGYVFDEETGLYYLRSRYYSPLNLIFLNMDISCGSGGILLSHNGYYYVNNNPVIYIDPDGRSAVHIVLGVAAIVGVIIGAVAAIAGVAGVPRQVNPFKDDPESKGANATYTLDFFVTRPWYVSTTIVDSFNEEIESYELEEERLRNSLWSASWAAFGILINPLLSAILGYSASEITNRGIIDFSVDYGEVQSGYYFTQVAVYSTYLEGNRTTYVARRTISAQSGSVLNSDWEYFAMGSSVDFKTAWDMALLPYPYPD